MTLHNIFVGKSSHWLINSMKQSSLEETKARVEAVFRNENYGERSLYAYRKTWKSLAVFMEIRGLKFYSREVGKAFLEENHGGKDYGELTRREKYEIRHIDVLTDIIEYGYVLQRKSPVWPKDKIFNGEIGKPFELFIQESGGLKSEKTIYAYRHRLDNLYRFMCESNTSFSSFNFREASSFLECLSKKNTPHHMEIILSTTRVFFRFLCRNHMLSDNREVFWMDVFKCKSMRSSRIPNVYTAEEVEKVISSIDRSNPSGKRDYAMILLAARYGIRASDIVGLRFCNIDWDFNRISLIQQKTGKNITLPLSEEVGSALVDYIRFARPKMDSPYVFLQGRTPYLPLTPGSIAYRVSLWMRNANVKISGRIGGTHALRHSLATNLLGLNEPMPVISEILGHSSCESTSYYTRISIDMLRQCALDVPFITSSFYDNLYE